jgi:signal transduction histidine kinase/DNA-binding response OmpR family regulator/HPt (histidine-containing phosphotransfer) domain-containing protein
MPDSNPAQELRRKLVLYSAAGMLVLGLAISFSGIYPLLRELQREMQKDLDQAAHLKILAVSQSLGHFRSVAEQITSRTKAREKLAAYNRGEVSLVELTRFSEPILEDAMSSSDQILGITRLDVKGEATVSVGRPLAEIGLQAGDETRIHGPLTVNGEPSVIVTAPILDRAGVRHGTDLVAFKISSLRHLMSGDMRWDETGKTMLGELQEGEFRSFFELAEFERTLFEDRVLLDKLALIQTRGSGALTWTGPQQKEVLMSARAMPGTSWLLVLKVNSSEAYQEVRDRMRPVAATILGLVLLGSLGMYMLVRPLAGRVLIHSDDLLRRIEEKAEEAKVARFVAENANRAKGEFLATMSHEIRTPMNGILGMTQLLMSSDINEEQRDYLKMVNGSADSLLRILNDVLDFSKIEAGKLDLETVTFALRHCLADSMRLLAARASDKHVELAFHIPPEIPDGLLGDPGRLRQIIMNLVGNAIKFTEEGEIVVEVKREDDASRPANEDKMRLMFSVIDTGVGIPREKQQQVFDEFGQADSSTSRHHGGTGLGLSISARLIKMMGGRIWLESEVGKGSKFHFTAEFGLQRDQSDLGQEIPASLHDLPVLIVDSHDTGRLILREMLESWHFAPVAIADTDNTQAALATAASRQDPFRVIIADAAATADISGWVADIRQSKEYRRVLIILLISADADTQRALSSAEGIDRCLTKPIKQSDLFNAITRAMGVATPEEDDAGETSIQAAPMHILLAEDGHVNQRVATDLLARHRHTVELANDGLAAVQLFAKNRYDLMLMDIHMPEMDGYEATASIRELERERGETNPTPIIALTANAMKGDREKCLAAGMNDYIAKPIRAADLYAVVLRNAPFHTGNSKPAADAPVTPLPEITAPMEPAAPLSAPTTGDPSQPHGDPIWDLEVALTNVGSSEEILVSMIDCFFEEKDSLLPILEEAVAAGDAEVVHRTAHTMKSSVATFGAERARGAAYELEKTGKSGDLTAAARQLGVFVTELEQLCVALKAHGDLEKPD